MFDVLSKPNVGELLRMPLFADVPTETIEKVVDSFVIRRLKRREVLIAPDQPNHYLYLILSGQLAVYLDPALAESVCTFGPGEPLGELSIIDKHTTSAYVVAEEDSRLLVLDEGQVWSLVRESHIFSRNMLVNLAERLRRTNQLVSLKSREENAFYDYGMLDVLTGMHSRRWCDQYIGRALKRCQMQGMPFSLLLTDIDEFGQFNERHGRMAGDMALNKIARTIQENLRATELAVRFGGDRLLVILPETDLVLTRKVAERLRLKLMYTDIPGPGGRQFAPLTLSIGIASATPDQTVEDLLETLDTALRRAKEMGRNFVSD